MKRKAAQASQHLATAILAINEIYEEFKEAAEMVGTAYELPGEEGETMPEIPHADYAEYLKNIMLSIHVDREAVLSFSMRAWALSEDDLKTFL